MPEKFQCVIQCLHQLPDEQFKFKNLINLLLAEESHQFLCEKELSSVSGSVVQEVCRACKLSVPCSSGQSQEERTFSVLDIISPDIMLMTVFQKFL